MRVTPRQARIVFAWLENWRPPEYGDSVLGRVMTDLVKDTHDVASLRKFFERMSSRKRPGGCRKPITINISRADAEWLASKTTITGLVGFARSRRYLPADVLDLGEKCRRGLKRYRGRWALTGSKLEHAINRQKTLILSGEIEERHLRRLEASRRQQLLMRGRGETLALAIRAAFKNVT